MAGSGQHFKQRDCLRGFIFSLQDQAVFCFKLLNLARDGDVGEVWEVEWAVQETR